MLGPIPHRRNLQLPACYLFPYTTLFRSRAIIVEWTDTHTTAIAKLDIASGDLVTEIGTIVEHNLFEGQRARLHSPKQIISPTGSGRTLFGRITRVPANHAVNGFVSGLPS